MKIFRLLFVLGIGFNSFSQLSLQTDFNSTYIGRNQSLTVHYNWNKFELYSGFKYGINKGYSATDGSLFKKTAHAVTPFEHLGAMVGFKYDFVQLENFTLFGFFESQHSHSHIALDYELAVGTTTQYGQEEMTVVTREDYVGPYWFSENNIGIGYKINVFHGLYLNSKIGGGIMLFKNLDDNSPVIVGGSNSSFCYLLSFGLGYQFNTKTK